MENTIDTTIHGRALTFCLFALILAPPWMNPLALLEEEQFILAVAGGVGELRTNRP